MQARLYDVGREIKDIVLEAVNELNDEYKRLLPSAEYDSLATPSACLSVLRLNSDMIEFFQIGDCVSVILNKDNEVEVFLDDSVPKLDNMVIDTVIKISREKNIPYSDALIYGKEQLIHNRRKRNTPDGYWILDLSGIGVEHAYTKSFPVCDVKAAAIMSDGFADIVDLFHLYDYKTLMEKMESTGLNSLCDELFNAQDEDHTMVNYPRLKHRDDSSVAWFNVQVRPLTGAELGEI